MSYSRRLSIVLVVSIFILGASSHVGAEKGKDQKEPGVGKSVLDLHYKGGANKQGPARARALVRRSCLQLNERQIRSAFEAAGATPTEIDGFSTRIMEKIRELQSAVSESPRP